VTWVTSSTTVSVAKAALAAELKAIGGKKSAFPTEFSPMLANSADTPFQQLGWLYEPKLDGIRCIAMVQGGKTTLLSRRGLDITCQYPSIARGIASAVAMDAILDGEIVALDEDGKPSFQLLQQRMNLSNELDVCRAEVDIPALYFAFDILHLGQHDLTKVPLEQRKNLLEHLLLPCTNVQITSHFVGDCSVVYDVCMAHGFEGIVAKRLDSHYEVGRRSANWVKIKPTKVSEFVVGGYTVGQGDRNTTFGALLLGHYDGHGNLLYVGSVGTGFSDKLLSDTVRSLESLRTNDCPFKQKPADKPGSVWLRPDRVAEVKFMEWTNDRKLRGPVFLKFREDLNHSQVKQLRSVIIS
jgi:bifunctional non-homologous end joining protein LigD